MQEVAKLSLAWRKAFPRSQKPMTATGVKRAEQLARGGRLSVDDLISMRAFLIRHKKNFRPNKIDTMGRPSKGTVSYWGWGGTEKDRSLAWIEDKLEKVGYFS